MVFQKTKIIISTAFAIFLIAGFACSSSSESDTDSSTTAAAAVPAPQPTAVPTVAPVAAPTSTPEPPKTKSYDSPPEMTIDETKDYTAVFELEKGASFTVDLYDQWAPITVNNFVFLANDVFYDGVTIQI